MRCRRTYCRMTVAILVAHLIPILVMATPQLKLSLALPARVALYSAVPLEVTVENEGDEPVTIIQLGSRPSVQLEIQKAGDGSPFYTGVPTVASHYDEMSRPKVLKATEKLSFSVLLSCEMTGQKDLGQPLFREIGSYRLRGKRGILYREGEARQLATIESPWVAFNVVEAQPEDMVALGMLRTLPNPCWLFEPGEALFRASADDRLVYEHAYTEFLTKYPNSYWSPFAHLALAYLYEARAIHPMSHVDAASLNEAAKHLNAIRDWKESPVAEKVEAVKGSVELARSNKEAAAGNPRSRTPHVGISGPMSEEESREVSQETWEAIEPWRQHYQEQLKAGKITQKEVDQKLVVAQLKLVVAVRQQQREMRQKWKAGEITEQDYRQWLLKQAQDLYQKENPSP